MNKKNKPKKMLYDILVSQNKLTTKMEWIFLLGTFLYLIVWFSHFSPIIDNLIGYYLMVVNGLLKVGVLTN